MKRSEARARLRRDLAEMAARVTTDEERAWEQMMQRIDAEPDGPALEVITMTDIQTESPTEPRTGRQRRNVGLAVAAVVVVAGLLGAFSDRGRELADLDTSAGTGAASEQRFVASMVDAFNDIDPNRWRAHFAPGADVFGADVDLEMNEDYFAGFMALGHRIELTGGCETLVDATDRHRVRCPIRQTDGFHSVGGMEIVDTVTISFTDGLISRMTYDTVGTNRSVSYFTDYLDMDIDFRVWIETAHPEIAAVLSDTETSRVEASETFVRYAHDFVAQSDEYPVG